MTTGYYPFSGDLTCQLPANLFQVSLSLAKKPPESVTHTQTEQQSSTEARSALVVDDVDDVTELLSLILTHAGYDVVTVSSAPAALAMARERHFDVVISDIGMPEMNGYQLARALRELPEYKSTPFVAVTGYAMFDDRQRSLSAGFNAHMTKPIDPRAFLNLVEQL